MNNGLKVKVAATALALASMFSSVVPAAAGTLSGMGERSISSSSTSQIVGIATKTTDNQYSYLTMGDVSIYNYVQAMTGSETVSGAFIQSNPWTACYENSTIYMGQYISVEAYAGQRIMLFATKAGVATQAYTAEFTSWDYQ